jgi:hypothetical protein
MRRNKFMQTEVALIFAVSGIMGAILTTQLWQMNWFKRENFKIQKSNIMAENRIKIKKLERELGINTSTKGKTNIDLTQLKTLGKELLGVDTESLTGNDWLDGIIQGITNYAEENPEVVQNVISKLNIGKQQNQDQLYEN